jgi:hypothetical protein
MDDHIAILSINATTSLMSFNCATLHPYGDLFHDATQLVKWESLSCNQAGTMKYRKTTTHCQF